MAKTKAELVKDAKAKGLTLTGDETSSELKDLLATVGVDEGDIEPEPEPETAAAVRDTAKALADAKDVLAEAQAAHDEAQAAHQEATKAPLPVIGTQCLVEGSLNPVNLPNPEDGPYPRSFMLNGKGYEHVDNGAGVTKDGKPAVAWIYRGM